MFEYTIRLRAVMGSDDAIRVIDERDGAVVFDGNTRATLLLHHSLKMRAPRNPQCRTVVMRTMDALHKPQPANVDVVPIL